MRKMLPVLLAVLLLFGGRAAARGEEAVAVTVAGQSLAGAFLQQDTTLVPLRAFCALMAPGCRVEWDGARRTATVTAPGLTLTAQDGAAYVMANGRCLYTGGGSYVTAAGAFVLPVRVLAKAFGAGVVWEAASCSVAVSAAGEPLVSGEEYYPEDAVLWLARIISAEARGEPLAGQIAVGNVVCNRVAHADYPDTIYGVIFDRRGGVQFSPAANGSVWDAPSESAFLAARLVLDGADTAGESLYFLNESIAESLWIVKNRSFVTTIGAHSFYQ